MSRQHHHDKTAASAETVTVDEAAALAMKIGEEIWGKEQFDLMMASSTQPSVPDRLSRNRNKKESA